MSQYYGRSGGGSTVVLALTDGNIEVPRFAKLCALPTLTLIMPLCPRCHGDSLVSGSHLRAPCGIGPPPQTRVRRKGELGSERGSTRERYTLPWRRAKRHWRESGRVTNPGGGMRECGGGGQAVQVKPVTPIWSEPIKWELFPLESYLQLLLSDGDRLVYEHVPCRLCCYAL